MQIKSQNVTSVGTNKTDVLWILYIHELMLLRLLGRMRAAALNSLFSFIITKINNVTSINK